VLQGATFNAEGVWKKEFMMNKTRVLYVKENIGGVCPSRGNAIWKFENDSEMGLATVALFTGDLLKYQVDGHGSEMGGFEYLHKTTDLGAIIEFIENNLPERCRWEAMHWT
jgi:hypothetical protein